jgi:hypothetical protein
MTNTYSHAKRELEILSKSATDPDNRPIIEPFIKEILALCEKFGNSGQSGGSAPYTATALSNAIKKLCLQEPICPITGIDEEWNDVANYDNDTPLYQNNRCSGLFKEGKSGIPYYLDAVIKKTPNGTCWHGCFWKSKEDYLTGNTNLKIAPKWYIKSFPFTPTTFYIDVLEDEVAPDDWEMYMKNPKQLKAVYKYYSGPYEK